MLTKEELQNMALGEESKLQSRHISYVSIKYTSILANTWEVSGII